MLCCTPSSPRQRSPLPLTSRGGRVQSSGRGFSEALLAAEGAGVSPAHPLSCLVSHASARCSAFRKPPCPGLCVRLCVHMHVCMHTC